MRHSSSGIGLHELVRLSFPAGSTLSSPAETASRTVCWASRSSLPIDPATFEPDDLVIVSGANGHPSWPETFRTLEAGKAAALAIGSPMPPDLLRHAEAIGFPVVVWPDDVPAREIERRVLSLLLDRQTHLASLGADIQSRLARLSVENAGLAAMVRAMGEMTGKSVLLQNKRMEPLSGFTQPTLRDFWQDVTTHLGDPSELPTELRDRRKAAGASRPELQVLPGGLARLVCPVVVKEMARGYLSIIGASSEFDSLDELVALQGAAACAVEMAKAKAVSEAEKRLRGDFVDAALTGTLPASEGARWASRIGYDPEPPHAAVVWTWEGETHPSLRRLETVVAMEQARVGLTALVRVRDAEVVAFCAEDDAGAAKSATVFAQGVLRAAAQEFPGTPLACGVGRPADNLSKWKDSYREAHQALAMARRLSEQGPMYYGDLSVYRLLFLLEGHPELESFCRSVLGPILDYEGAADLLDTLAAYFAHHGNLSQTAEALFIHRNTLQYRLDRITKIAGFDLDNPETRLAVQLALKARRLLPGRP